MLNVRKSGIVLATAMLLLLVACNQAPTTTTSAESTSESRQERVSNVEVSDDSITEERMIVDEAEVFELESLYIKNVGDPSNLYWIDDNDTLWGVGSNDCGQLAQGSQDNDFHEDAHIIAENVIHMDYSQNKFMVFLTDEGKLYGVGNAGSGALMQYDLFDWIRFTNGNQYYISSPVLLMEDVRYARCGRDDVVAMKKDGTVWTWGTIYAMGRYADENVYFVEKPIQILDNAILVTGGWFNHAALLNDGSVWTWGYNSVGNCGIEGNEVIKDPVCVANHAAMVWTGDLDLAPYYERIEEYDGVYPCQYNNTVIQKTDGTYWACGENIGTVEREVHGQEADYRVIWSSEFQQIESMDYFLQHQTF